MCIYGCLDWSKYINFTPLGEKKECSQHLADKIIYMQVDFGAAKISTEKYEIILNWAVLCRAPIYFTELIRNSAYYLKQNENLCIRKINAKLCQKVQW